MIQGDFDKLARVNLSSLGLVSIVFAKLLGSSNRLDNSASYSRTI